MLVGLQGSGKTTTAGKLANLLRKQGKKPLLVACDVYRPAAIKQLQVVGKQLNIPVFSNETSKDVVHIAKQAMSTAISKLNDVIILDTAGRLHIDEDLMNELKSLKANVKPHEILLVVDSMTGQDAVNVAEAVQIGQAYVGNEYEKCASKQLAKHFPAGSDDEQVVDEAGHQNKKNSNKDVLRVLQLVVFKKQIGKNKRHEDVYSAYIGYFALV